MSALSTFIGGGGGVKTWVSGAPVLQRALVVSPADNEVYIRKTATGSGTTDPADDTTNYNAVSYSRVLNLPVPPVIARSAPAGTFAANIAMSGIPATSSAGT